MASITANTKGMTKGYSAAGGATLNCGDSVATSLVGVSTTALGQLAHDLDIDYDKYSHLNPGHKRMVLGQSFRKMVKDYDKKVAFVNQGNEVEVFEHETAEDGALFASGAEWFETMVAAAVATVGETRDPPVKKSRVPNNTEDADSTPDEVAA